MVIYTVLAKKSKKIEESEKIKKSLNNFWGPCQVLNPLPSQVAVLVQLREIHAGIQMCSQDRVNEAVYPFIDINQHMSTELSALEEFASKQGYRPVKVSNVLDLETINKGHE